MDWTESMSENKANREKTRAERLTIVYVIYQALIFFSVSGGTGHWWWVPLAFSFSISVVYFSCFFDALVMFDRFQFESDITRIEPARSRTLDQICGDTKPDQISFLHDMSEEVRRRGVKRRVVLGLVVVLLIVFAVVMLIGCWLVPAAAVDGGSLIVTR